MVQSFPLPPLQTILTALINDLHEAASPIVVVLDDYQFISSPVMHDGLAFFLDRLPPNVHVVIATRADPPLPLARLRTRGELTEVRADDLRFSLDEATQLLNRIIGLELGAPQLAQLEQRTEGWVAALQLAALALKSIAQTRPSDTATYVANFSGSNRYILDYLVEEVFSHEPPAVQDFLLRTSLLDRLSGSLCDAVMGPEWQKGVSGAQPGQQILEALERANLFLVPLDAERRWFRYHHLFADLLRARLEQQSSRRVAELHLRASEWYEQNGLVSEAVSHALAARAYEPACRLIDRVVEQRIVQNDMVSLLGWIQRLPPELARTRPWLCITQAWSCMFLNAPDGIEPLLKLAEQAIRPDDRPDLQKTWRGHVACLRAFVADVHGDGPRTIEMAELALECLRADDAAQRTFANYMLGRAHLLAGNLPQASTVLTGNLRACMEARATNIVAPTLSALSRIYRLAGRLSASVEDLQAGRAYVEESDPRRVTVAGVVLVGQAAVLRERNDLATAEALARRAVELCEPWENPSATCGCYALLARVLQAQGRFAEAGEALDLADKSIRGRSPFAEALSDLDAARVSLWLATGQLSRASDWAADHLRRADRNLPFSVSQEEHDLTLARVLAAERKPEPALRLLDRLAAPAKEGGRLGSLVEIRALQALAHEALGNRTQALKMLELCLDLAEPEKYCRLFLNEGQPMQTLLQAYLRTPAPVHQAYGQRLLAGFPGAGQAAFAGQASDLVESLTSRELEILRLLADGLSNRQIADRLFLAEGTVKFYVHSLLAKLGAQNRTQAVTEAKRHKLL
jgi:LuxR family maltose regulon positive regulatory protein